VCVPVCGGVEGGLEGFLDSNREMNTREWVCVWGGGSRVRRRN